MSTKILGVRVFSEWVKKKRIAEGRSHSAVAAFSGNGISASYVGHIETETVKAADLTLKKLIALAKGLNVSPHIVINAALQDALNYSQTNIKFDSTEDEKRLRENKPRKGSKKYGTEG